MPELPEVESIIRGLRPQLVGRTVLSADVYWKRTLASPSAGRFRQQVARQVITSVERRAKFIHLVLSRLHLLIHLRMSGDLLLRPRESPLLPHDRLVLHLDDGRQLAFNDPRKFGRAWLTADPQSVLGRLGPEPLDKALTPSRFHDSLHQRHRQLKPLLLDQSFLAGLGNIYTDEALHLAGLHPLALSDTINREQAGRLLQAIRRVLRAGIASNGASIDWVYRGGEFQNHFRVYGRTGEACPVCRAPIQRLVVGQRSTHVCPTCQRR